MAIELHIQIDHKREDNTFATRLNSDDETTSGEIACLLLEMEKIKQHLINAEINIDEEK